MQKLTFKTPPNHHSRPSLFHHLLKILAVYDSLVVVCVAVSYGLPDVLPAGYLDLHHPRVVQWMLPLTHVAVTTSVYCTVLISFERYVRICFFCQLRATRCVRVVVENEGDGGQFV